MSSNPNENILTGERFGAAAKKTNNILGDRIFRVVLTACGALILIIVAAMIAVMTQSSWLSIQKFGFGFLTGQTWDPIKGEFGALPFIYGTIVSAVLALLIATPISVGVAIFLVEQAPKSLARPMAFLVELLAAIPSVVYGLWAIFVLAPLLRVYVQPFLQQTLGFLPFFKGTANGIGMMSGGIILAIMITPIITAVVRDVLEAVPVTQREAALALGATRWETTKIVLANANSGIAGAIVLGLGRAIGETMAITMIIGNRPEISASLFDPGYTIASVIANEFTEATGELYLSALIEMGLILFLVTFIVNGLAKLLILSVSRQTAQSQ
ncbi:MAG: Phosphate transport system permease protein PstC [uncultured Pyrinomonadaceae bacterium]|uniref:Phosphate transport system permease protein n=1 Tax=uncultured Pyrinomonadaceae bacterium TaxID=2283094 RepID=A0A6J4P8I6_9BACT|nr:MAG: Phosphate transport system permease protein PstC [uncultured Pyrinomonadaceae bacterium]